MKKNKQEENQDLYDDCITVSHTQPTNKDHDQCLLNDKAFGKHIYRLRKELSKRNSDVPLKIRKELESKRETIKKLLAANECQRAINILNKCCFKHMMPKSDLDETPFTPYNTNAMDIYNLNSYLNVSEILLGDKIYLATQKPDLRTFDTFVRLLHNGKINTIVSLIPNDEHLKLVPCLLSEKIVHNNETLFFKEKYDFNGRNVNVLRFFNWIDHSIIHKDKIEFFYHTIGDIITYPILVHCKAGIGRTGFFIMYDYLRNKKKVLMDEFIDVFFTLRSSRSGTVWSERQLSYLLDLFVDK